MKSMDRNYIWDATEFSILLSLYGIDDVFMFPLIAEENVGREPFLFAIYSLVESGYIYPTYSSDKSYALASEIKKSLTPLAEASRILEFQYQADNPNKLVFGSKDSWTVVEPDSISNVYRVKPLDTDGILVWFDELPVWSADRLDTDEEISTLSAFDDRFKKIIDELSTNRAEYVKPVVRCLKNSEDNGCSLELVHLDGYMYMLARNRDGIECCVYTEDSRKRIRSELFLT